MLDRLTILCGDALEQLKTLPDESVHCCVTSPPYWGLRDYGVPGQLGLEKTPEDYVGKMVEVFREVRRVLREDGTLWLNLGDSYAASRSYQVADNKNPAVGPQRNMAQATPPPGLKQKDLVGIPWRVAFALQNDGWYLRSDIIWHKPNPMPESVTDRPTKSHEYLFLLSKNERYFYDAEAVKEPQSDNPSTIERYNYKRSNGKKLTANKDINWKDDDLTYWPTSGRNKRTVWTVPSFAFPESHFATYPPDLIKPCILAGCPVGGTVLDPFGGSGTTGMVALELGRKAMLIELNPEYVHLIKQRCDVTPGLCLA